MVFYYVNLITFKEKNNHFTLYDEHIFNFLEKYRLARHVLHYYNNNQNYNNKFYCSMHLRFKYIH